MRKPNKNLKAVGHGFQKVMTSCGPGTLCDGPEAPTQWKSVNVSDYELTNTDLRTGVTARDAYASKNR